MHYHACIHCVPVYKNKYATDDNWTFYIKKKKYLDHPIKSVGHFVVKIN